MKIDIIIGHSSTDSFRIRNIKHIIKYYSRHLPNSNIIVVEQKTNTKITGKNLKHIILNKDEKYYNRSLGLNIGYKNSSADLLILSDNDCLVDVNILKNIDNYMNDCDVFIPYNFVYYMNDEESASVIKNNKINDSFGAPRRKKNASHGGVNFIKSDKYMEIGGHDMHFRGWGGEDDVFFYLCKKFLKVKRTPGDYKMYHLYHPVESNNKHKRTDDYKFNKHRVNIVRGYSEKECLEYISERKKELNKL